MQESLKSNSDVERGHSLGSKEAPYEPSNKPSSEPSFKALKDPNREGGARANLTLLGAFCGLFCTVGVINAFGVFQEYYKQHQLSDKSEFQISWIGSFSTFMLYTGTVPAGILVDKIGPTIPLAAGSVCLLLGTFMTSLCKEYWQFFLAQALLMGIGFSFVLTPCVAIVPRYFKKNRALGMGITIAGSSTGGIIWPIMLNNLFNSTSLGFGWSLRIVGFVMIPLLLAVCLTVRLPLVAKPDMSSMQEKAESGGVAAPEEPKVSILKNPPLVILCAGLGVVYLGFFGPFFYLSSYSVSLGQSTSFSFYLISILNAASFVGRVLPGYIADRYGAWNVFLISAILSAIIAFCWTAATSIAGVVVWSLAYGFASGAIISLQAACGVSLVPPKDSGKAIGMVMGSVALTALFGSPICGQLVTHYGYLPMSMFTGATLLAGALIVSVARFKLERRLFAVK